MNNSFSYNDYDSKTIASEKDKRRAQKALATAVMCILGFIRDNSALFSSDENTNPSSLSGSFLAFLTNEESIDLVGSKNATSRIKKIFNQVNFSQESINYLFDNNEKNEKKFDFSALKDIVFENRDNIQNQTFSLDTMSLSTKTQVINSLITCSYYFTPVNQDNDSYLPFSNKPDSSYSLSIVELAVRTAIDYAKNGNPICVEMPDVSDADSYPPDGGESLLLLTLSLLLEKACKADGPIQNQVQAIVRSDAQVFAAQAIILLVTGDKSLMKHVEKSMPRSRILENTYKSYNKNENENPSIRLTSYLNEGIFSSKSHDIFICYCPKNALENSSSWLISNNIAVETSKHISRVSSVIRNEDLSHVNFDSLIVVSKDHNNLDSIYLASLRKSILEKLCHGSEPENIPEDEISMYSSDFSMFGSYKINFDEYSEFNATLNNIVKRQPIDQLANSFKIKELDAYKDSKDKIYDLNYLSYYNKLPIDDKIESINLNELFEKYLSSSLEISGEDPESEFIELANDLNKKYLASANAGGIPSSDMTRATSDPESE